RVLRWPGGLLRGGRGRLWVTSAAIAASLSGCGGGSEPAPPPDGHEGAAPTNRVEINAAVRQNLGITFARVERRNVARTLRVPGRFELLPTAAREYRSPVSGRVEVLVSQYEDVEEGTPLYRID